MRARKIDEQNEYMLWRQRNFRIAVEYVARELGQIPAVQKVALFGSVIKELREEVPRFREFRKAGIAVLHECKDVDLAVWVSDLTCLRALQRANAHGLNLLLAERNIGVAHHQVDIFLMAPGTDRYLGRLCKFGACPRERKIECRVPGCGATAFLQQHVDFAFDSNGVKAPDAVVLWERK